MAAGSGWPVGWSLQAGSRGRLCSATRSVQTHNLCNRPGHTCSSACLPIFAAPTLPLPALLLLLCRCQHARQPACTPSWRSACARHQQPHPRTQLSFLRTTHNRRQEGPGQAAGQAGGGEEEVRHP